MFLGFTLNSLYFSRIHFKSTIFFAIFLWIQLIYRGFTNYKATSLWIYIVNSERIHVVFRGVSLNSLYLSRIHFQSTIFFMISLWVHLMYRDFSINWISIMRIHYKLTVIFRKITLNLLSLSRINYDFTLFFKDSLSIKRIYYEFTVFIVFSKNSRGVSRFNFELTIY